MKIGFVGCVKSKRAQLTAARDQYRSPLFAGRRRWVERTCDRWFVLSAKHGFVHPDVVLAPCDVTLNDLNRQQRRTWASGVISALEEALGPLRGHVFEIHAGDAYAEFELADGLRRA